MTAVQWGGEGVLGVREDYVILLRFLRFNPLMMLHRAKTKNSRGLLIFNNIPFTTGIY